MNMLSPGDIQVLLHCYCTADPYPHPDCASITKLLQLKAIKETDEAGSYNTTPLGEAWVKALCSVPMPRVAFIDEQGRVLEP